MTEPKTVVLLLVNYLSHLFYISFFSLVLPSLALNIISFYLISWLIGCGFLCYVRSVKEFVDIVKTTTVINNYLIWSLCQVDSSSRPLFPEYS